MLAVLWYHNVFAVLFAFLALLLMLVVLLQRGKGVGLAGAFGGAGGHSAFGAKTGDVLTWITVVMIVIFLFFAIVGNYTFVTPASTLGKSRDAELINPNPPAAEAPPAATTGAPPSPAPQPATAPVATAPAESPTAKPTVETPAETPAATQESPKQPNGGGR